MTVRALRYYEAAGLVVPTRLPNGYRDYDPNAIRLVTEIRALTSLGLSVEETRPFVQCLASGHGSGDECPASLAAYRHAIAQMPERISRLIRRRDALAAHLEAAANRSMPAFASDDPSVLPVNLLDLSTPARRPAPAHVRCRWHEAVPAADHDRGWWCRGTGLLSGVPAGQACHRGPGLASPPSGGPGMSGVARIGLTPLAGQVQRRRPAVESGSYPPRFALSLARKDADVVMSAADAARRELRLARAVRSWLADAESAGLGGADYTALIGHILSSSAGSEGGDDT